MRAWCGWPVARLSNRPQPFQNRFFRRAWGGKAVANAGDRQASGFADAQKVTVRLVTLGQDQRVHVLQDHASPVAMFWK